MKKLYPLLAFVLLHSAVLSQDISIDNVISPVSGCNLSCTEDFKVFIQNQTIIPIGSTFTVSYSVNGASPVTESITTFMAGFASYNYSFLTDPVLCAQGTYNIQVAVNLPGDTDPTNDTLNVVIVNDTTVVPGTMLGSTTVCANANSGDIQLTGYTGYIGQWEYSTNSGTSWTPISDTTDLYHYVNLGTTTVFHVLLDGGYCPGGVSPWAIVDTDEPTQAGFLVSGDTTVCGTGNSGLISLTSYNGSILGWAYSTNGGASFSSISNTTDTETFSGLSQTTLYAAIVQNGVCAPDTSSTVTIHVDAPGVAGTVMTDTTVCFGKTGELTLAGHSGNIFCWLSSTNSGASWSPINNHDTLQAYTGTVTIEYTAVVQNGVCPADTAVPATVTVLPLPVAFAGVDDTLSVGDTLCFNATGGTSYSWTPALFLSNTTIANPCMIPTASGTYVYTVSVVDAAGCGDDDHVTILVLDTATTVSPVDTLPVIVDLVVCNFVTPNNDGDNDVWNIIGIEQYPDNNVKVINKHGQIVFEQSSYKNTWNGNSLPDGSYYYMVKVNAMDRLFKGILTITSSRN